MGDCVHDDTIRGEESVMAKIEALTNYRLAACWPWSLRQAATRDRATQPHTLIQRAFSFANRQHLVFQYMRETRTGLFDCTSLGQISEYSDSGWFI
jgi:hypothetical protein